MNVSQKKLSKRAKLIQRKSNFSYKTCKNLAKIRAIYDYYRIVC